MNIFDKYILLSLGSNCNVKKYIDTIKPNNPTQFFDYIGTSMWAINELIENDFTDIFNKDDFENMRTSTKYGDIVTNKKYYLRFLHDLKNIDHDKTKVYTINNKIHVCKANNFAECKDKYDRRRQRFIDILTSSNKILFIRLEEDNRDRIIYDIYKDKLQKSELEYTFDLSNTLKRKYSGLDFMILVISFNHDTTYYQEHNVIVLKMIDIIDEYETADSKIEKLIIFNKAFLLSIL
jgi:hypothetical protein